MFDNSENLPCWVNISWDQCTTTATTPIQLLLSSAVPSADQIRTPPSSPWKKRNITKCRFRPSRILHYFHTCVCVFVTCSPWPPWPTWPLWPFRLIKKIIKKLNSLTLYCWTHQFWLRNISWNETNKWFPSPPQYLSQCAKVTDYALSRRWETELPIWANRQNLLTSVIFSKKLLISI